jgi:tRNA(adenine34) deaminase
MAPDPWRPTGSIDAQHADDPKVATTVPRPSSATTAEPTPAPTDTPAALPDDEAMAHALAEAARAVAHGDVPVGAVVVVDGQVVAACHNERQLAADPTAHAEVLALREAATARGSWRLDGATLVVTLEPCPMCAGAALAARVARVVFGAFDPKAGACGSLYNLCVDPRLNHEIAVTGGVRAAEAAALLTEFFAVRRHQADGDPPAG